MLEELFKNGPEILNAVQVSTLLGISKSGVYNLMNLSDFPLIMVGGRKMVAKSELIEWLIKHTRSSENMDLSVR